MILSKIDVPQGHQNMTDRQEPITAKSTLWEKLPLEVVWHILKFLNRSDLRSCRLLNKSTTEEATRLLFSTLEFGPRVSTYKRAILIEHPRFGKYIRNFDYQSVWEYYPDHHPDNLRRVIESIKTRQFDSVSLTRIGLADAIYLFSADEQRESVFKNAKELNLIFNGYESHDDAFLEHLDEVLCQVSRNLLAKLSRVQNITFGFSKGHNFVWEARTAMTEHLLSLNFPELTTLTLENVITTQDGLIDFLVRHRTTLRSLTLSGLALDASKDFPKTLVLNRGFGSILRLLVSINRETSLGHVSLQKRIEVHAVNDNTIHWGYPVVFRRNDEMKSPTKNSMRQKLEDFLCHRAEFPFYFLRPYMDDLAEGKLRTNSGVVIVSCGDFGARLEVYPETDDTIYLQDMENFDDDGNFFGDFGPDDIDVDTDEEE